MLKEIDVNRVISIDETGIDNNITSFRGWSEIGKKIFVEALGFRSKRLTLISGYNYGEKKLIAPIEYEGYTNRKVFEYWVENCLCKELRPEHIVIMDNASFHKSTKIRELIEQIGCTLIYIPAYSPDLNPIEHVWANLKKLIRKNPKTEQNLSDAIIESMAGLNLI